MDDRDKGMAELGAKVRAGTLMSTLFRAVASEMTERVNIKVPGKEGKMETRLVSKAEAIVRDMIQMAMPKRQTDADDPDFVDPKLQLECRKIILDRVDGRAGTTGEDSSSKGESIPDKISRINKDFLNDQAKAATKEKKKSSPPNVSLCKRPETMSGDMSGKEPIQEKE